MIVSAEVDELLGQARECVQRGDYAQAIGHYRRMIEADELSLPAHEGLARAAFLAHEYDLAIKHFERVSQLDPRRPGALINLGAVQNRKGDFQAAVQTLRKALARDRKSAEAYYNLGLAHRGLSQLSMAVSAYKEAIRLNPEMAEAYQNLANVFVEMGNADQAILHYRRALEIRPEFERARRGLERAMGLKEQARSATSPFGRLVDISKVKKAGEDRTARPLTDQERFEDRAMVYTKAKEAQRAATALCRQLQSELEPDLLDFTRALNQSKDIRGFWDEYTLLRETGETFEELLGVLERCTDDLRAHEDAIARITSETLGESA